MPEPDDKLTHIAGVISDTDGEHPMERARAVLRAIRNPTAAMIDRGVYQTTWRFTPKRSRQVRGIFNAMIDATLDAEPCAPATPKEG